MSWLRPWRGSWRRRLGVVLVGLLAVALAAPPAAVLLSFRVRDYLYRELGYRLILDQVVGGLTDPERIALRLNDFIHESVYPSGGAVLDVTPWNDLVRGIGWCDQMDWSVATLLARKGIHGRVVFLTDQADTTSPHTMLEVLLDGEWRALDPLFGLAFYRPDGRLATIADLSRDPSLIYEHPEVRALAPEAQAYVRAFFGKMFPARQEFGRWGSLLEARNADLLRWSATELVELTMAWFGPWSAHRFQDLYLWLLPDELLTPSLGPGGRGQLVKVRRSEDPAAFLYFKARNYHLYERVALAEGVYEEIIRRFPESRYAEYSRFFRAFLSLRSLKGYSVAVARFSDYLRRYPDSPWAARAHYYLGQAYEGAGDLERARYHYLLASSDPYTDATSRLAELERAAGDRPSPSGRLEALRR